MLTSTPWLRLVCIAMAAAFCAAPWGMAHSETVGAEAILQGLGLGKPGDKPIGLQAWYDKEPSHSYQTGDRVIMSFQTDRGGYVLVLNVIPGRSVHILFPNKEHPSAAVHKGAVYSLFGDDSRLRLSLGKKIENARLVFCVSAKPFDLTSLKKQEDDLGIKLGSEAEIQVLRERLQAISADEGFNRIVQPFSEGQEYGFETDLTMSPESGPPGTRALPGAAESEQPGTVTGTQGIRQEPGSK